MTLLELCWGHLGSFVWSLEVLGGHLGDLGGLLGGPRGATGRHLGAIWSPLGALGGDLEADTELICTEIRVNSHRATAKSEFGGNAESFAPVDRNQGFAL